MCDFQGALDACFLSFGAVDVMREPALPAGRKRIEPCGGFLIELEHLGKFLAEINVVGIRIGHERQLDFIAKAGADFLQCSTQSAG